ncbi:MAG TPA: SPOR domain-containing protein [Steroidobacteraceae bacterium]|nr:SPOR domain-containing protein [Steroidobacteraceae bacterium]
MRHVLVALMIVSLALASGCSRRQQEWEAARHADTVQAYQRFLASFPQGEFASQAQARVRELEEAEDWQKAMRADTPEAYQEFVTRHPQGRMSDEARIRIGNLALAQTPSGTPQEMGAPAVPGAVLTPGVASPIATAAPEGAYHIQLGAFAGGDKQAMNEWRRLQGEYPQLLGGLTPSVKLATTTSGHLYRLQAGVMSEERARSACAALKSKGQACVVVPP